MAWTRAQMCVTHEYIHATMIGRGYIPLQIGSNINLIYIEGV
jgi:hypothetical protein